MHSDVADGTFHAVAPATQRREPKAGKVSRNLAFFADLREFRHPASAPAADAQKPLDFIGELSFPSRVRFTALPATPNDPTEALDPQTTRRRLWPPKQPDGGSGFSNGPTEALGSQTARRRLWVPKTDQLRLWRARTATIGPDRQWSGPGTRPCRTGFAPKFLFHRMLQGHTWGVSRVYLAS